MLQKAFVKPYRTKPHPSGTPNGGWVKIDDIEKVPLCLRPLKIRDAIFPNRIWMSPMCMYSADTDGVPNLFHVVEYGRVAVHGAGLVTVEATAVLPEGRISSRDLGLYSDEQAAAFKDIVELAHGFNTPIAIQLGHAGRKASTYPATHSSKMGTMDANSEGWPDQVVGPTAESYNPETFVVPKEMTLDDIAKVIDAFGQAAKRANDAGFDVVEIHAAHGYLIHSFLSPYSNKRTDKYGGSFENRTRFLVEIAQAIRTSWPKEKPLFLRVSASDNFSPKAGPSWQVQDTVELIKLVQRLNLGIDLVDCSSGMLAAIAHVDKSPRFQRSLAAEIKKQVPEMLISTVGYMTKPEDIEDDCLVSCKLDAVNVARQFLRTPSFAVDTAIALYKKQKALNPDAAVGWELAPPRQFALAYL